MYNSNLVSLMSFVNKTMLINSTYCMLFTRCAEISLWVLLSYLNEVVQCWCI